MNTSLSDNMNNNDLTTNVESDNLNNNTSSNGSSNVSSSDPLNKKRKRIRYKHMNNIEAKRIVEETKKPDDTTCIICYDKEADHQLIHLTQKNGSKKENLCQKRFCFSCIQKCIAAQKNKQGKVIHPLCPCCKQRVEKAVNVKNLQVIELPSFFKPREEQILLNAQQKKLAFCIDINENDDQFCNWEILLPSESHLTTNNRFKKSNNWQTIWRYTLNFCGRNNGWPSPIEVLSGIKTKLEMENLLDRTWLPPIYGGTMKLPKRSRMQKSRTTKKRLKKK